MKKTIVESKANIARKQQQETKESNSRRRGDRQKGLELSDTLKWEGAVAHQVANPHRMVQRNGMVLSSLISSFKLVQSILVSSAEQK